MIRPANIIGCLLFLGSMAVAEEESSPVLKVGMQAPDMTLTGIDGESFKLSDITARGKNVALMFSRAHW